MRRLARTIGVLAACVGMLACSAGEGRPGSTPRAPTGGASVQQVDTANPAEEGTVIELPEPRTDGGMSLERALSLRRSVRGFSAETLTLEELSQLLWAAQGITVSWGGRTAPSAGALYPLEIYAATPTGLLHYLPEGHLAEVTTSTDVRSALGEASYGQAAVTQAPVVLAIAAVPARTATKYGTRAERYVQLEAGHAAQNVLLQAVALGLGAVPVGAFSDADVARVLGLPPGWVPLYLVPVGHPAEA